MTTRNILAAAFVALALGACGPESEADDSTGELETQDPATQPEILFHGIDVEEPAAALNVPRRINAGMRNPTLLGKEALRAPKEQVPHLRQDVGDIRIQQQQ